MIVYHRNNYVPDTLDETVNHVRQHISAIASPDDNPDQYADEVEITLSQNEDNSTRVYGELDRDPAVDYSLPEGFEMPDRDRYQRGFGCLLYTSPSPRDRQKSRMPSSA